MTAGAAWISPRDVVRRHADAHGDRVAAIAGDARVTYGRLAERTGALAAALRRAGVGPGVQVAVMLSNSVSSIAWYYAVLEAGGIVVQLSPSLTGPEARDMIGASGAWFVAATDAAFLPSDLDIPLERCSAPESEGCLWRVSRDLPRIDTTPWTGPGYMTRRTSSGSTGRPKHVFKTEANLAFDLETYSAAFGFDRSDVFLGALPFFSPFGSYAFTLAMYIGACVTILPRFLPSAVLEAARRDRPTVFFASPAMIETLSTCVLGDGDETAFRTLKFCAAGGVQLRREVREAFRSRFGVPVHTQYGATESHTVAVDTDEPFVEGRAGRPLPGVEVRIVDEDDVTLPAGAIGRIAVRNPAASTSYIDDPESTAQVFRDGWVFPGDRGYLDSAGRLHLLGRDDVINIDGKKVDPLEVARVIREAVPIREVVVFAADRAGLPTLRAIVEADPLRVTAKMVVDACRARLSTYKVPTQVDVRDRLERNAAGKILMSSLVAADNKK
jgi:long-chain acyl-CoA synthetase